MKVLRGMVLLAVVGFIPGRAAADAVYLAVGDSSAFGETDRTRDPPDGDRGYVAPFADFVAARTGGVRPTVVNTAINGETTQSFFTGQVADRDSTDGVTLNANYQGFAPNYPSQSSYLLTLVRMQLAADSTIDTVTVQLGANDLSKTAEADGFLDLSPQGQQQAILASPGTIQQNYAQVLGLIRALLPAADLYVIGYHNPYGGAPSHPLYALAAPAVQGLNRVVAGVGGAFGATYVDFYTPVIGRERELTLIDRFPADQINYVHLNDAGYQLESQQLIRAATPVPAPPGVVLGGVGVLLLWGRRFVARKV